MGATGANGIASYRGRGAALQANVVVCETTEVAGAASVAWAGAIESADVVDPADYGGEEVASEPEMGVGDTAEVANAAGARVREAA